MNVPSLRLVTRWALFCLLLSACSEEGVTPNCPDDLPLYDVRETAEREAPIVIEKRSEALALGCETGPAGGAAGAGTN